MTSPIKFLRRVRIHGGECGAVARALHHEIKTSSLSAVFGNVPDTTFERKLMTNKSTTFKRVALALVASLSFGVFGSGQATAVLNTSSNAPSLTLSAATASAAPGETVSVTVTVNYTSTAAYESVNVVMNDVSNVTERFKGLTTDSQNVRTSASTSWHAPTPGAANSYLLLETANTFSVFASTRPDSVVAATSTGIYVNSNENSSTPTPVQAKMTLELIVGTNATAGVYTYAVTLRSITNGSITNYDSETLQLTVTAKNLTASAAKSKLYVNQALCTLGACDGVGSGGTAYAIEADSTLTVSAGTVAPGSTQTFTAVGYMFAILNNSADTKTVTGDAVTGTIKVTLSGPGWLASVSDSTKRKSVDVTASSETITIYSDGSPGTTTITGYIGTTALTQAAKTVTFTGKAATITTTDTSVVRLNAAASLSARAADSVTVGTKLLTFTAKDSAGNAITDLSMNANGTLYCVSSDTSVIGTGTGTAPNAYKAVTALTSGVWGCDMVIRAAGTASVTIADESIVASSAVKSTARSFTFANAVNSTTKGIGTITFDKTSYVLGEQAVITVTVLNSAKTAPGMVKVDGDEYTTATVFPTLLQNKQFSGYVTGSGSVTYGFGSGRTGTTFDLTGSTFVRGVETYVVFMPTTTGKVTLTGFTTDGTNDTATAVSVSVDVVDPNAALINAATASADAATDAAAEAIDAANAATDAANLAAEAADAATVAAEEARDAADAATAAVEELATAVATLMAALKAQVTTLANTVAKIAKKVGVKKP